MDCVYVVAMNRAGRITASTSCAKEDAGRFAKYYRSLKENGMNRFDSVKVFTFEDLEAHKNQWEKETKYDNKICLLFP